MKYASSKSKLVRGTKIPKESFLFLTKIVLKIAEKKQNSSGGLRSSEKYE